MNRALARYLCLCIAVYLQFLCVKLLIIVYFHKVFAFFLSLFYRERLNEYEKARHTVVYSGLCKG